MKYKEAIERSNKLKVGMGQSAVLKLLGEPDEKKGGRWTYDFDKLEKWPPMSGPDGPIGSSHWTFREKGYVAYVKTEDFPWTPRVLRHLLGIIVSFRSGKVSGIKCEIGVTLGRQ